MRADVGALGGVDVRRRPRADGPHRVHPHLPERGKVIHFCGRQGHCRRLGIGVTVARLTLDQLVKVQIFHPQLLRCGASRDSSRHTSAFRPPNQGEAPARTTWQNNRSSPVFCLHKGNAQAYVCLGAMMYGIGSLKCGHLRLSAEDVNPESSVLTGLGGRCSSRRPSTILGR